MQIPNLKEATYTAQPHLIVYTITYDLEGGIQSSAIPVVNPENPTEFTMRSATITLNNPTRTGYQFVGWTGYNGDTPEMTITIPTGSKRHRSYVANWEQLDVTYEVQHFLMKVDGTYSSTPDTTETFVALADSFVTPDVQTHVGFTSPDPQSTIVLPNGTTVVKYKYERNKYLVTIDRDIHIESTTGAGYHYYEEAVTLEATPMPGYKLNGWTGDYEGTNSTLTFIMPTSDVNVSISTDVIIYTIEYDLKGNKPNASTAPSDPSNPTSFTVETDSFTLKNPTRTGYDFDGWTGAGISTPTKTVTITKGSLNNREYVANWTARKDIPYKVKHYQQNLNDNNYTLVETDELIGEADKQVTPARKSYTGFKQPSAQTKVIAPNGSMVIEYKYERNKYTIALNKGTGIASVSGAGTYKYGASVTINATLSTAHEYQWNKWTGDKTSNTQNYTFTMPAQNISITANATEIVSFAIYSATDS